MGGEKVQILLYEDIQKGSPPRGRGKVTFTGALKCSLRITPAWAGKSLNFALNVDWFGDHPRVGGEKITVWNGSV